ncbi:MAG: pseudouridine synthase [Bacteroidia bacterium]
MRKPAKKSGRSGGRSRTTKVPAKFFTKKSELKGWKKPKKSVEGDDDKDEFRFKKPGSRGKAINLFKDKKQVQPPKPKKNKNTAQQDLNEGNDIRLNRYLSNAGVASRRDADELIKAGLVSINGKTVTELGTKVKPGDIVKFNGQRLSVEQKIYIVMNKPKDTITTADDPEGRKTVMELFEGQVEERIFPVGRLDRNTTGVLLFTNDGELAQRLTHPKYNIKKVYKATLDKNFKPTDMYNLLNNGVELEDGPIKPDAIAMPDPNNKNVVGIEIHSGRNRIVHRMFEAMGYKVDKLDRALFGNIGRLKLKRGEWRHLTEKELKELKRLVNLH